MSNMVKGSRTVKVNVVRNGDFTEIEANQLVPGDVIEVQNEFLVPADCVLISGEVLVDEAMLTGEATAMTKTSMISSEKPFDVDGERLHVLYGGTKVLLTRIPNGMCKAIVLRTGFNTAKGAMVQSILFPKPINIKFESDGLKLGCLHKSFISAPSFMRVKL